MKGQPFKRLNLIFSLMSEIPALTDSNYEERQKMFAALPEYLSRGKGKGKMLPQKANKHAHMSFVRAAKRKKMKMRNK